MTHLTALMALLKLIEASGGTVETRIRIQKMAYLLASRGVDAFRLRSFSYHHYGPFSRELSDTLQFAVSAGLLEEAREAFSENTRYSYRLTDSGRAFLQESGPILVRCLDVIRRLQNEHWRTLELAATVDFLRRTHAFRDESEALRKALDLKPETVPFVEPAQRLLCDLAQQA